MSIHLISFFLDHYKERLTEATTRKERMFLGSQLEYYQKLLKTKI